MLHAGTAPLLPVLLAPAAQKHSSHVRMRERERHWIERLIEVTALGNIGTSQMHVVSDTEMR